MDRMFVGYDFKFRLGQSNGRVFRMDEPVDMPRGYAARVAKMAGGRRDRKPYGAGESELQVFVAGDLLVIGSRTYRDLETCRHRIPAVKSVSGLEYARILFDKEHPLTLRNLDGDKVSFIPREFPHA